jgi:hypothetical protein
MRTLARVEWWEGGARRRRSHSCSLRDVKTTARAMGAAHDGSHRVSFLYLMRMHLRCAIEYLRILLSSSVDLPLNMGPRINWMLPS